MAAQATANERIDLKLSAIAAEIDSLPVIAEEWPHMLDDHQAAFLLEWDEMMARMESLDRAFHSHDMTSTQQALYSTLLRKLKEATPTGATAWPHGTTGGPEALSKPVFRKPSL